MSEIRYEIVDSDTDDVCYAKPNVGFVWKNNVCKPTITVDRYSRFSVTRTDSCGFVFVPPGEFTVDQVITNVDQILELIKTPRVGDTIVRMCVSDGKIVDTGDFKLANEIEAHGYKKYL